MFRVLRLLCLAVMVASCTNADSEEINMIINHYEIHVPKGYIVKNVTPRLADFDQLQISSIADPKQKFDIYIGNHPFFPMFSWGEDVPGSGSVMKEKSYSYREADGTFEGLLIFSNVSYNGHESPFSRLHYFGRGVERKYAGDFEKIVSSIKIVKPNLE